MTDLSKKANSAAYAPKLNWKQTAQPEIGCSSEEYHALSVEAQDELLGQQQAFMRQNGFSFMVIPSEDFKSYETDTSKSFREWLDDYCDEHVLYSGVDVALIGPDVKTPESANRKAETGERAPDRIRDYLRCMPVILKQSPKAPQNKNSLATLGRFVDAMEADQDRALARKNYFWEPHDGTGIRCHKTLWNCTVPDDSDLAGFSVLAEIKVEHESHMDIDRLTRTFLEHGRKSRDLMTQFAEQVVNPYTSSFGFTIDPKTFSAKARQTARTDGMVKEWGRMLYEHVNVRHGFDRMRNPEDGATQAMSIRDIAKKIKDDLATLPDGQAQFFRKHLKASRLFPKQSCFAFDAPEI